MFMGELPAGETSPAFFELPVNNSRDAIVANIRANLKRGLPGITQQPFVETPLLIVGGGPSVTDYLPILQALRAGSHVLAINGAYKFLLERGIEPDHFVLMDSRAENVCHVNSPCKKTHHYIAAQAHPDVFDKLKDYDVTIFHLATEAGIEATEGETVNYLTAPIGMASVHAIYLATALGYKNIALFGYDFSHSVEKKYAYPQPLNDKDDVFEIDLNGKRFRTTLSLARTAEQFVRSVAPVMRACKINVNLYSEGLLAEMLKNSQLAPTEESERTKYELMWQQPAYRKVSAGMRSVEEAVTSLGIKQGDSITDFGCGMGWCVKWFIEQGYESTGVDITDVALDADVPFVKAALWDLDKLPKAQYGFSSDVLEHIPPDRVMDTLKAIHDSTSKAVYLNIDTIPDAFGILIGEKLHLTVRPAKEWEADLRKIWKEVKCLHANDGEAIFVCRRA